MTEEKEKGKELAESGKASRSDAGRWWQPALAIFGEVTGWIVLPIIAALYGGKYLDERYGTGNWYFLGLTAIAFIISCTGIGIVGARYIKQIERTSTKNEHDAKRTDV